MGGIKKVFINLCKGFDELGIKYSANTPFNKIKPDEPVVVLGNGKHTLAGYNMPNPIIAGIGLMTHPAEWPDLFKVYLVAKYLQHSAWTRDIYTPYYGVDNCLIWPSGIDTKRWAPNGIKKVYDFLIYDKVMWPGLADNILRKVIDKLTKAGYSYQIIKYGSYREEEYYNLLQQSRAMIFLCEHESQGFACCEAMAVNVPVYAWDQGFWLDPNYVTNGKPVIKATSVPFFDERCGLTFVNYNGFEKTLNTFWSSVTDNKYNPRAYILENLTLEKSAQDMLKIIEGVYK